MFINNGILRDKSKSFNQHLFKCNNRLSSELQTKSNGTDKEERKTDPLSSSDEMPRSYSNNLQDPCYNGSGTQDSDDLLAVSAMDMHKTDSKPKHKKKKLKLSTLKKYRSVRQEKPKGLEQKAAVTPFIVPDVNSNEYESKDGGSDTPKKNQQKKKTKKRRNMMKKLKLGFGQSV